MDRKELIEKLEEWNKTERRKRGDKEITLFKNSDEVFKIFGAEEERVLNPFNDSTYEWLSSFFSDLQDFLKSNEGDIEELLEEFRDSIYEYIDAETSVYTSDLTEWLNDNNNNVYYLNEAIEETGEKDGFKLLQIAQSKAIEELYRNALSIIMDLVSE